MLSYAVSTLSASSRPDSIIFLASASSHVQSTAPTIPRLGLEGRALLLRADGQGVRLLRVRRAGLQRCARRAQAVEALHPGEAGAGVRDGARDREEVAALPRRRAGPEVRPGQGAGEASGGCGYVRGAGFYGEE